MEYHSDQKYVQALLDNDNLLLAEIYSQNSARVAAWIRQNSGNSDDAADMMQEALIAISKQARRPTGLVLTCPFSSYLLMVVRGKWLNELKRRKRASVTISEADGLEDKVVAMHLASETLESDARQNLFKTFFAKLPDGCQKLIQLSWTGISMQEVAESLNVSYAYARKRKSECIAKLMESIQGSEEFKILKTLNF